jgi:hypothetical protein
MADERSEKEHRDQSRKAHNEEFVRRLLARRPAAKERYAPPVARETSDFVEEGAVAGVEPREEGDTDAVLETIVRKERPVLFIKKDWVDTDDVADIGEEAKELVADLDARCSALKPLIPLIGRIDVVGYPGNDFVGTGWFVDTDVVVTNRHVASLVARWDGRKFAFMRGVAGRPMTSAVSTLHEFDDATADPGRVFAVTEVLYIERDDGPDVAFLRVARRTDGTTRDRITVAKSDVGDNVPVFVVGYPARAPKSVIPDQALMRQLYRDRYDVKRAAPGFTMAAAGGATRHDCTTLGGNSGSVVLGLNSGEAVGLHFAGLYQETNYAVRASVLSDYVDRQRWRQPPIAVETRPPPAPAPAGHDAVTFTLPLSIRVSVGQPLGASVQAVIGVPGDRAAGSRDLAGAERAAKAFWRRRPDGVIAVRVGFEDDGAIIGDRPLIAASVPGSRRDEVAARGLAEFDGFAVRYFAASVAEQIDALPTLEAASSIEYDDGARTAAKFSFDPVEEAMTVRTHVGPEYSWDELRAFLAGARTSLVAAIYEFHAPQIKDAIEARLKDGVSLTLVMDNATFSGTEDEEGDESEAFDRIPTFARWKKRFRQKFERIVAPEGKAGLISDAYHIKVTVREDDTFWLSSGNWKKGSSQPVITRAQRDDAAGRDLPGNREWHVVVKSRTLASRLRNHIAQDFKRSRQLGGGPVPPSRETAADILIDVPIEEEAVVPERRPASRLLVPREFARRVKARALLTPDREGAVYSQAVLALIRSAEDSLLFQIPYIAMRSDPDADRGFIDELIDALTRKLKTLRDARVILRAGGSRFSAPTHTAWHFRSKGVDIDAQLRQIQNHHTKGMIVDGRQVLLGSHNWSKSGVTLNRDASLIFDDAEIAGYYAEAFEIDWARANPVAPRRFVKPEHAVMREAAGAAPPPGFRRVRLSELLKEDD